MGTQNPASAAASSAAAACAASSSSSSAAACASTAGSKTADYQPYLPFSPDRASIISNVKLKFNISIKEQNSKAKSQYCSGHDAGGEGGAMSVKKFLL